MSSFNDLKRWFNNIKGTVDLIYSQHSTCQIHTVQHSTCQIHNVQHSACQIHNVQHSTCHNQNDCSLSNKSPSYFNRPD